MFYKDERLALLIDGPNLHSATKSLSLEIDYKRMKQEFARRGRLLRMVYYTALNEKDEYNPVRPLTDWLSYNGISVKTKPVKEYTDALGRPRFKGSMTVELTTDAMMIAEHVDHMVLGTGDGDYRYLVEKLQDMGKRVSIMSSLKSSPPMVSDELRRQADNFIDIDDLREVIEREARS
ncbi:NYN domain-containing protein [Sulfitobacter sp. R18_1]|uniref:LabA-like NYN domain-containing protein n=1 Tax=Sulfitobacter sp. R18_1 TaxID=2821104 RepID=UPI001ADBD1BE|nr:NYN domain-containing protein [Sulfitobacter sp. R18_1]MBO9428379.1 NYN domain-containing protein [Sulfitobacter sp. R18_1]